MGEGTTRFSIIIPVYNVKEYLAECLDSLLAQTFRNFEVIIVDDVSTDGSKDLALSYAARYPEKITVLEHTVNTRQGGARNTGIEAATGEYLLFVDSDDYLVPKALELLAATIKRENADIVECCFSCVDEKGNYLRRSSFRDRIARLGVHKPLLISVMGPCNKAYRTSLFRNTGIRFPEKYYYEDYWTVPKVLMAAKKVVYIEDPLYCYRQRTSSTIHDTNADRNRDIMLGTDELLRYFHEQSASKEDLKVLESLATEHVLFHTTLRVNSIDPHSKIQRELKDYMQAHFPNYLQNPYLYRFSSREKRLLKLISGEQYFLLNLLWYQRNRLSGWIKQLIRR